MIEPSLAMRLRRFTARPAFRMAAAAVVLLAGAAWWFASREAAPDDAGKPRLAPQRPVATAPGLVRSSLPPEKLPPADQDFSRRMGRFIVPEFKATGVPLADALDTLRKNIAAVDRTAVPDFSAAADFPPDLSVHVVLRSQTIATLLDVIAIQTGVKFQPSGRGYVVSQNPDATPPGGDVAVTFPAEALRQLQPPRDLKALLESTGTSAPAAPRLANGEWDAGAVVQAIRMSLGDMPGLVGFSEDGAQIDVSGSARLGEMLRRVLTPPAGTSYPPGTWEWKVVMVELSSAEGREKLTAAQRSGGEFTEARWKLFLRELAQSKGVDLRSSPALLTGAGAQASHFSGEASPDPNDPGGWTGVRLGISNQIAGDRDGSVGVQVVIQEKADGPDGVPVISTSQMGTAVSAFPDGNTRLVTMNETEDSTLAVFVTGKRDPVRDDLPYGIPVPVGDKKGFVYSPYAPEKGKIDVDGLKRGTRVECPYSGKHFRVP